MKEFKSPPVPTLRIHEAPKYDQQNSSQDNHLWIKPLGTRRATDPTPSSTLGWGPNVAYRPRNVSPYSPGHVRSHSAASTQTPPMSRARSMPGVNRVGYFNIGSPARPSSPAGSPNRNRALRKPVDEIFPALPNRGLKIDTSGHVPIPEEEEEEETPRASDLSSSPGLTPSNTHPQLRRSSSPSRNLSIHYPTSGATTPTSPSSVASSPLYQTSRYDSFGGYTFSTSASSVPTTPSSHRSRSPSISSLETIPDSPDAEEAALEAERIAQLKAAADAADGDDASRQGVDIIIGRGRKLSPSFGRDKSKRWSVCGAERRGDLDLETIWED